ncbi:MAG: EI24 domain-containing protein [Alphaproteobacteria bacterium]|nr:EI24 domain-containing protein [Alphaproteobacteria bacterium]
MLFEFKSAIKDIFSSKIRSLIWGSALLTLLIFIILFFSFSHAVSLLPLTDMPKVQKIVEVFGYIIFFILSLMFFPSVVTFISGFFIDSVVNRMAARNNIHALRTVPLKESLALSGVAAIKGIMVSIGLALASLLFGLIPFINLVPVILYYGLNGRLLAREYFFAAALRYLEKQDAEDLFNRYQAYWVRAGIIIAILMTVPIVNMIAPLIAMAFMQRLFLKKNPNREKA